MSEQQRCYVFSIGTEHHVESELDETKPCEMSKDYVRQTITIKRLHSKILKTWVTVESSESCHMLSLDDDDYENEANQIEFEQFELGERNEVQKLSFVRRGPDRPDGCDHADCPHDKIIVHLKYIDPEKLKQHDPEWIDHKGPEVRIKCETP